MLRTLTAVAVLLSLHALPASAAGFSRRYMPLTGTARAVAPLPGDGFAILGGGVVVVVDAAGLVRAAQEAAFRTEELTTAPGGEIFLSRPDDTGAVEVTKLEADLTAAWSRRFSVRSYSTQMTGASDGGVVLQLGMVGSTSVVVKLRADGTPDWTIGFDGAQVNRVREIPGGFVFAGSSRSMPWLAVTNKKAEVRWQRTYALTHGQLFDVAPAPGGGLVAVGNFVLRTTADGSVVWVAGVDKPVTIDVLAVTGNGYVMTADVDRHGTTAILAIDDAGQVRWQRQVQRRGAGHLGGRMRASLLAGASDGAALISPYSENMVLLFKFDAATGESGCSWFTPGTLQWSHSTIVVEPLAAAVTRPSPKSEALPVPSWGPASIAAAGAPCFAATATAAAPAVPFRAIDEATIEETKRVAELMKKRDWDALEAAAAAARTSVSPDPMNPYRASQFFYQAAAESDTESATLERLRAWVAARPDSFTARIALAKGLRSAAWRHRGFASVSDQQRLEYRPLIAEAKAAIEAAGKAAEVDPYYWQQLTAITAESGGEIRPLARRALAVLPNPQVAWNGANYVLPMWGGTTKEALAWTDEAVKLTRAAYGEALYFPLALHVYRNTPSAERKTSGVDWQRLKRAAEDLIRKNPKWLPTYHDYARAAFEFNDQATAKALFERPELAWYEGAEREWHARPRYEEIRKWALTGAEPFKFLPPVKAAGAEPFQPAPPVEPAGAPFIKQPATSWPAIVTGADGAASFVLDTGSGVLTTVTAGPATQGTGVIGKATPLNGKPPVTPVPLVPRPGWLDNAKVFIAGCHWNAGKCEQFVVEGRASSMTGTGGQTDMFIRLAQPLPRSSFRGAVVLDEKGFAIGVTNERANVTSGDGTMIVIADKLQPVVQAMPVTQRR